MLFSNSGVRAICRRRFDAGVDARLPSCGYHVAGQADLVPKTVHTIAIPAFTNITTRYKLTDRLPQAIGHEFIARTKYQVVNDPAQADAVLRGVGHQLRCLSHPVRSANGRASGLQVNVTMQVNLVERATGKVHFLAPQLRDASALRDQRHFFQGLL